jgi:hypothetical protein
VNDSQTGSVDAATIDDWSFMAAMPYLALKEPCGTEFFKFLRGNDPELEPYKQQSEATRALTENFHDIGGERRVGSALLLATGRFPRPDVVGEAAVSIRNAYAISCISLGWQRTVGALNCHGNLFADQYDFYPLFPNRNGTRLICENSAQTVPYLANKFSGLLYPDVPFDPLLGPPEPDPIVWPVFIECWMRYYIDGEDVWPLRAIFRSLAHAFRGARLPKGSDSLLIDYGIQLGLWYSAMECLLKPENEPVNIVKVITFLGRRKWNNARLDDRAKKWVNGWMDLNFVQRVGKEAYDLRNTILHGDSVSTKDFLKPQSIPEGLLNLIFPLLYQVAVEEFAFENSFVERPDPDAVERLFEAKNIADALALTVNQQMMEEALCTFLLGRCRTEEERWSDRGLEIIKTEQNGQVHSHIRPMRTKDLPES